MERETTTARRECCAAIVRASRRVVVAFSGWIDSTLVAKVARNVLGADAIAETAVSPSLAKVDLEEALALTSAIGIEHRLIESAETEKAEYQRKLPATVAFCRGGRRNWEPMNSSNISTSPEAVRRNVDAMPHANPTGLCRQIPGTGNPKTAITMITYRILQEDKELPRTYITNTLDAQKHYLLQCFKYAGFPKEDRAMVREATSIDASSNPDIKEKLDFIADAKSRVHHVAEGFIPGKSGGAEKLKSILAKNMESIGPEKLMLVVKANKNVLTPDEMRGVRASIALAREDSPVSAYFDKNQKPGIHWYLMLIGGTQL